MAALDDARITVDDDVDAGSRSPVKVAALTQPTDKEIEEHELKKDDHQIKEFRRSRDRRWHAGWNPKHLSRYRAPSDIRIRDILGLCVGEPTVVSQYCQF